MKRKGEEAKDLEDNIWRCPQGDKHEDILHQRTADKYKREIFVENQENLSEKVWSRKNQENIVEELRNDKENIYEANIDEIETFEENILRVSQEALQEDMFNRRVEDYENQENTFENFGKRKKMSSLTKTKS